MKDKEDIIRAAEIADWGQIMLNGGPPCFHIDLERDGRRFCLRAQRWAGHTDKDSWPEHPFLSFDAMIRGIYER